MGMEERQQPAIKLHRTFELPPFHQAAFFAAGMGGQGGSGNYRY
jgi:hypothetical protein